MKYQQQTFSNTESHTYISRISLVLSFLFQSIVGDKQTYAGYLGRSLEAILGVRQCPVKSMTLCVTSPAELSKCSRMRTALKAQLLQPEMSCYRADTHFGCMRVTNLEFLKFLMNSIKIISSQFLRQFAVESRTLPCSTPVTSTRPV